MFTYPVWGGGSIDPLANIKTGMVSWWTFDEETGTRADSHGGNDLTVDTNGPSFISGMAGNAADFDGTNDGLKKASPTTIRGDNTWSLATWLRLDVLPGGSNRFAFFGSVDSTVVSNSDADWALYYDDAANAFNLSIYTGVNRNSCSASTFGAASTGTWYFVYCYFNHLTNQAGICVNDGVTDTISIPTPPNANGAEFYAGKLSAAYPYYLNGKIDETGHWSRVLTSDEVTALYNSGSGVAYSSLP